MRGLPSALLASVMSLMIGCVSNGGDDGGDDTGSPEEFVAPPVQGDPRAPVLTSLSFRCEQPGSVTCDEGCLSFWLDMTDPDGLEDVELLDQVLRVFPDADGTGAPLELTFYTYSGEVFFNGAGSAEVFHGAAGAATRNEACAAAWWPSEVSIRDASGHATIAKVRATRVQ